MQIFRVLTCLVMWIYVLFGALASGHPGNSRAEWRTSRHSGDRAQENDVIKSEGRKKVLHKPSSSWKFNSNTKNRQTTINGKAVPTSSKPGQDLKLFWFLNADRNRDGFVSVKEYARSQSKRIREATMLVDSFDLDNDRLVSKSEYLRMTANSVGQYTYKAKFREHRSCSVKSVNKCAVTLFRNILKNRGQARCAEVTAFDQCVSRHSRKCDSKTRRTLQRLAKTIVEIMKPKQDCRTKTWRNTSKNNRTVKTSHRPEGVLVCSKDVIQSLVSGDNGCDMLKQYKSCIQRQFRSAPRQLRRSLKHSARGVAKTCRKVRDNI